MNENQLKSKFYALSRIITKLQMITKLMEKSGAIPTDWRHFYQELDEAILSLQKAIESEMSK